ncbi:hypothetical protein BDN72DRAFT_782012 [Pluteus cervinus]|uniref:Uncharacterized protein n=1 Tax=Pluteus cervinus TaxID=181527 RepID=A0ACD2ZYZ3_9AGAR|nr:hypothetical protein BDN72DRAFT_782012 [Pluteus cervinus]
MQSFTFQRYQVPLQPAFCITAHRAQGMTMDRVIVDLSHCSGSESPYVMVSRTRSLQGLKILRPFAFNTIKKNLSEDLRKEFARLKRSESETEMRRSTVLDYVHSVLEHSSCASERNEQSNIRGVSKKRSRVDSIRNEASVAKRPRISDRV